MGTELAQRGSHVCASAAAPAGPPRALRAIAAVRLVPAATAVAIVWLWYHGGNVTEVHSTGELLTSMARITGLLGAYLALVQVLLLARLPALERLVGLRPPDRLAPLERPRLPLPDPRPRRLLVLGYALLDRLSLPRRSRP